MKNLMGNRLTPLVRGGGLNSNPSRKGSFVLPSLNAVSDFFSSWWVLITLLSIATLLVFFYLWLGSKTLRLRAYDAIILALLHTLLGVASVWFFAQLEAGFDSSRAGNLSLYGGIFLMPLFYLAFAKIRKRPIEQVFDAFAPCLVATLLLARVNCLVNGCCLGITMSNGKRFPASAVEITFQAVTLFVLFYLGYTQKAKGILYPIYMVGYGIFRFILEWFREADLSPLHMGHIWSIVSVVFGVAWIWIRVLASKAKKRKGVEA